LSGLIACAITPFKKLEALRECFYNVDTLKENTSMESGVDRRHEPSHRYAWRSSQMIGLDSFGESYQCLHGAVQ
jgi:hypothetical protein